MDWLPVAPAPFPRVSERGMVGHVDGDLRDLYNACYRRLVAQVFAVTTDIAAAEDATAQAFARAVVAPRAFRRADDPEAWLRVTALTCALRRSRRAGMLSRAIRLIPGSRPGRGGVGGDDRYRRRPAWDGVDLDAGQEALLHGLRRLPDREREVVALYHLAALRCTRSPRCSTSPTARCTPGWTAGSGDCPLRAVSDESR